MTNKEFLSRVWANEDQMTADTYKWVSYNYPKLRPYFFHVANELDKIQGETQQSHMRRLGKAAAKGVLAGVPDFVCVAPVFALELKMPGKKPSPNQVMIHGYWAGAGVPLSVVRTAQEIIDFFHSIEISEY